MRVKSIAALRIHENCFFPITSGSSIQRYKVFSPLVIGIHIIVEVNSWKAKISQTCLFNWALMVLAKEKLQWGQVGNYISIYHNCHVSSGISLFFLCEIKDELSFLCYCILWIFVFYLIHAYILWVFYPYFVSYRWGCISLFAIIFFGKLHFKKWGFAIIIQWKCFHGWSRWTNWFLQ